MNVRCLAATIVYMVAAVGPAVVAVIAVAGVGVGWVQASGAGIPVLFLGVATDAFGAGHWLGRWVAA